MSESLKVGLSHKKQKQEVMSFQEFIDLIPIDKGTYHNVYERLLIAIGEPELVDTSRDSRLKIIHGNQIIPIYKPFKHLFGVEHELARVVSFIKHAAQGLEESRQILALIGPVASAKSTIAEALKSLVEKVPVYVLAVNTSEGIKLSPNFESPLGLLSESDAEELKIPLRYLQLHPLSSWAGKRLDEFEGDASQFKVVKLYPNKLREICVAKVEPGDENTQDTSVLIGKAKLRALGQFDQSDPDAYDFSGGLCRANQGLLEMVEMQKAKPPTLYPLLTATQEHNYKGTESIGAMPFSGMIISHTNTTEWEKFKSNRVNEAFIDRMYVVPVGYNLRRDEEILIYKKLLDSSSLSKAPCAPGVLDLLADFCILSRLTGRPGMNLVSKMKVYNGESMKAKDSSALTHADYKHGADIVEGFVGVSTRQAYKILSRVFNYDIEEVSANPVHLVTVLRDFVKEEALTKELADLYSNFINTHVVKELDKRLSADIKEAYIDSYDEYGQNIFIRYIAHANHWLREEDYKDPVTGHIFNRKALDDELSKIELRAGISNAKEFRREIRDYSLMHQAKHNGNYPDWKSYQAIKEVIDANITESMKVMLPVIGTVGTASKDGKEKKTAFINGMLAKGYTERQIQVITDWISQRQ